ncbi:MAG: DUF4350 domain-containing protein [Pseudomonadota bacterium]
MGERVAAIAVLVLVLGGLVALFFYTYERREVDVLVQSSEEARGNRLLAAQRLLTSLGYEVESRRRFAPSLELPPANATAVLTSRYAYLEQTELDTLLGWVADGGHLVVQIDSGPPRDIDPIFTPMGVSSRIREPEETEFEEDQDNGKNVQVTRDEIDTSAARPDREAWGLLAADNRVTIDLNDATPLRAVHDQHGVFAAQLRYNEGRVTAVADLQFTYNYLIKDRDHAFVFTQLLDPVAQSGPVWLLTGAEFPSLWLLLKERISPVMLAGIATLIMSLWWAAQRFGPMIPAPATARKAFVEHVHATGRFLWRHGRDEGLLDETRHALLADARRRHPPLRHGEQADHARYLSELSGLTLEQVNEALFGEPSGRNNDFTLRIQLLKSLWKRL